MCASGTGYKTKRAEWRKPPKPVKTLIFQEEGSQIAAKERLNKVALGLGVPLTADKFYLPLPEGMLETDEDRPYDWVTKPIDENHPYFKNLYFAFDSGVKLDVRAKVETLVNIVEEQKAELVVLDALTYMFNGDENDKSTMAVVMDGIKAMRSKGATVMYLVHLRKDDDDTDIDKVLRGHTILRDAYDLHLASRRPKDRDCITLHARYRDGRRRKFELFWNIPEEGQMGPVVLDLAEVTDAEKKGEPKELGPVEKLLKAGWLREIAYGYKMFARDLGLPDGTAAEIRGELITKGLLLPGPDGKSVVIPKG